LSFPEIRERSDSPPAAASRFRNFWIFSFLVLRRRISGRRLGADIETPFHLNDRGFMPQGIIEKGVDA